MDLLLKILGYLFLTLLIILIIAFFLLRYFWGKLKEMGRMFEPVELEIDPDPEWIKKSRVKALVSEFEALGFKPHRVYKETSMKIKPMILANDTRDQFGEIYHTPREIIAGFCTDTEDGMSLNVTTSSLSDTFVIKPHKITEGYPEADVAGLHDKFKALVADQPLKVIADEDFDDYLQEQINKDLQGRYESHELPLWQEGEAGFIERWRKHRHNDKDLLATFELLAAEALEKIQSEISDDLEQAEDLSAAVYTKYANSFILFNPGLHKNGFREYLDDHFVCWDDIKSKRLKKLADESDDSEAFFERFKAEYPQLEFEKFYSVSKPIQADLWGYEGPDDEDDE